MLSQNRAEGILVSTSPLTIISFIILFPHPCHTGMLYTKLANPRVVTVAIVGFIVLILTWPYNHYAYGYNIIYLELIQKSRCSCLGYIVTYECRVQGTNFGSTVWTGSAFNCSLDEILLKHRQFPENTYRECNNGSITGRSLKVDNGTYYVSQLNITISSNLIGKTIKCYHDANAGLSHLVGAVNITTSG